jgi:hypothetical protein
MRIQQFKVERLTTLAWQRLRLRRRGLESEVEVKSVRHCLNSIDKITRTPDVPFLVLEAIALPEDTRHIRALIDHLQDTVARAYH